MIEAAGQVFAAKGFEGATVREICKRGNANLAAVNYHFGDKRRLYIEAVKRAHQSRTEQFPLPEWTPGTPARQKLFDFVLTLLRRMTSPMVSQWEGDLLMREIGRPSDACQELAQDSIRPHFEVLCEVIAELAPSLDLRQRHLTAFSVVGQCLHYRVAAPVIQMLVADGEYDEYHPELLADHISKLTLDGLAGLERGA
jgi:AcrR family transcriptional regulator